MILVGERLATVARARSPRPPGWPRRTGARLAWVPRRAGDRGAVETGCLPNLLPGGRPVADAAARVDVATTWGVDDAARDRPAATPTQIVAAVDAGELGGLVVGGVDPDDTADPAAFRAALDAASFVVTLELRETDVTRAADVVFPVAAGHRQGRHLRHLGGPPALVRRGLHQPERRCPTCRVLAGIAEELGRPLGFRTVAEVARRRWRSSVPGTATAPRSTPVSRRSPPRPADHRALALATWKQLLDNGSMQDGDDNLRATARNAGRPGRPGGRTTPCGPTRHRHR